MAKRKRLVRQGPSGAGSLAVIAVVVIMACDSPYGLETIGIASVAITPDSIFLVPGDTVRLQGTATDSNGVGYAGASLQWRTSDATVAVITQEGLVTATGSGTATISGEVLGFVGSSVATVLNPPVVVLAAGTLSFAAVVGGADPPDQVVAFTNGGGGILESVTVGPVTHGATQPSGWLTADLSSSPDELLVRISIGGLTSGTYNATVGIGTFGTVDATLAVSLVIS